MWDNSKRVKPSYEEIYQRTTKDVLDLIVALREKRYSFDKIAGYLHENGYQSPHGKWNPHTISRLMKIHGLEEKQLYKVPDYRHIKEILELKESGKSLKEICEHLNSAGKYRPTGLPFTPHRLGIYIGQYKKFVEKYGDEMEKYTVPREDEDDF
jgi:hypothetical protein